MLQPESGPDERKEHMHGCTACVHVVTTIEDVKEQANVIMNYKGSTNLKVGDWSPGREPQGFSDREPHGFSGPSGLAAGER